MLKKSEENHQYTIRSIHSKTLQDIESDRKGFKLNREERQKKVLIIL